LREHRKSTAGLDRKVLIINTLRGEADEGLTAASGKRENSLGMAQKLIVPPASIERHPPRFKFDRHDASPSGRIFNAAVTLCAVHGFQITVRDITAKAGTNLAAVSYYYESKENLMRLVVKAAAGPINEMMLGELSAYEDFMGDRPLEVANIWNALASPLVHCSIFNSTWDWHIARIYIRASLKPDSPVSQPVSLTNSALIKRFVKALSRALPNLTEEEVYWRFYLGWGAILTATRDTYKGHAFRTLSKGACDPSDLNALLKQLVTFLTNATSCK
jgi:AcrR family transcriptional regulator